MELKIYPDDVLRKSCQPLREVGDSEAQRLHDMVDFMYECDGLGLAGPQIGWSARVVALDAEQDRTDPRIFINPTLHNPEGEVTAEEGCLSLPGIQVPVLRAERVKVKAYTLDGNQWEKVVENLEARAWQHEVDHLNGVLFIDRLQPTKLAQIRHQLKKLEEQQ